MGWTLRYLIFPEHTVTAEKNNPPACVTPTLSLPPVPRWTWSLALCWLVYSIAMLAWIDSNSTLKLLACLSR